MIITANTRGQLRMICLASAARDLVVTAFGVMLDISVGSDVDQVAAKDVTIDATFELRGEFQEWRGGCVYCGTAQCQLCSSQWSDPRLHSILRYEGPVKIQRSGWPVWIRLYTNGCHCVTLMWRLFLPARRDLLVAVLSEAMLMFSGKKNKGTESVALAGPVSILKLSHAAHAHSYVLSLRSRIR